MTTRAIRTESDREELIRLIQGRQLPFTASLVKGAPRSVDQNKLQRKWMLEAEEQGDQTAEEYRGYCKLHFGVPILRAEVAGYRELYDRIIRPLDYETKLIYMQVPFDFAVTRLMTTKQKARYLDLIYQHFRGLGFVLTEPNNE